MMDDVVTLVAVGDICPGDHYFTMGHGTASNDFFSDGLKIAEEVKNEILDSDVAFCNLECPLSVVSDVDDDVENSVFIGKPSFASHLAQAGFTVANIANNHISQHGPVAFANTIGHLHKNQIASIGHAVHNGLYSSAPLIKVVKGLAIGFLGYSLVKDQYFKQQTLYAVSPENQILRDVGRLASEVDIVVVSVHAGEEGILLPDPKIVSFFRNLIDAGARVVLGHHSHVFQPVEKWKEGIICYSLGDFIFDMFWDPLLIESAVLKITMKKKEIVDVSIFPVFFSKQYEISTFSDQFRRMFVNRIHKVRKAISMYDSALYHAQFENQIRRLEKIHPLQKWVFFVGHFFKGDTMLKTKFINKKLMEFMKAAIHG